MQETVSNTVENEMDEAAEQQDPTFDAAVLQRLLSEYAAQQNLIGGILAGLAAALVSAALWAVVTAATNYQIGWMAVGVGFLVGFAVRTVGKGVDKSFGVAGAVLALFGCLLGNFLVACYFLASAQEVPFFSVLSGVNLDLALTLMEATFSPMDLLFYGIAVYEGYILAFRQVTAEDLQRAAGTG